MELLCLGSGSPVDLLCAPVPSCLPSPQLRPDPVRLQPRDLIRFEREPVQDRQPRPTSALLAASDHDASVTDSPGRRAARNKVKLAANFSFTSTLPV